AVAVLTTAIIVGLNAKLAIDVIGGWIAASPGAWWVWGVVVPGAAALLLLLGYLVLAPLVLRRGTHPAAGPEPEPRLAAAGSLAGRGRGLTAEPEPSRWESGSYRRIAVAVELAEADDNVLHFLRRAELSSETQLVFVHVAESAASRWLGEQSLDSES